MDAKMLFQTFLKAAAAILGSNQPALPQTVYDLQPAQRPEYHLTHIVIHKLREKLMKTEEYAV